MSTAQNRPTCAVLLLAVMREHGPLTDLQLCDLMRRLHHVKSASTRGRRAELVRAGELERVGQTADGFGLFDIRGIVRAPKPAPSEQLALWND